MSKSIRIRTEPNGGDKHIKFQLNQDFDFLEILSLKISQEDVYRTFYSDYGAVVGRVIVNSGVGVPNAKVSIFIPLTEEDEEDVELSAIYPYTDISIVNSEGVRYNTLPSEKKGECHVPVGTFPKKRDIIDNDKLLEVYDKYYKYTTTTNDSGDFMIFGVPVGTHLLNVDVDLSDIGILSQRPYDFIDQGNPSKLFYSPTKFKSGKNLNNLTQLKNRQIGVNIIPFWGEALDEEVGITRVDIDLNYNLEPKAIFIGSIFGDTEKNSVNKNCRARKKLGKVCEMVEGGGTIKMLRKTLFNENERYDVQGGRPIDDNGVWAYQVPMNLDYMVTDEYGKLVRSEDVTKGIPTRARVRFKISMDVTGGEGRIRSRANYLVPHNPSEVTELDYSFDEGTSDDNFRDFYWNKIYTVKNHISRFQTDNKLSNRNFVGYKDVDDCPGQKNPLPYNTIDKDLNPLYIILCVVITAIVAIVSGVNKVIKIIKKLFGGLKYITINCNGDPFKPGIGDDTKLFNQCIRTLLAEELGVYELDFYNDWMNGSLYAFLFKYKETRTKTKFCGDDDGDGSNWILSTTDPKTKATKTYDTANANRMGSKDEGIIHGYEDELFYKPISSGGTLLYAADIFNLGSVLDCDWQAKPKINDKLIGSTYKIPPFTSDSEGENPEDVPSLIDPILFDIDCDGISSDVQQSEALRRLCEIGVDLDVDDHKNGYIDSQDIIDSLLRRNLIKLNDENKYNISVNDIYDGFKDSDYIDYRNEVEIKQIHQRLGNSFYFYFGTKPNRSAIEIMNSRYFTPCEETLINDIIITGEITDVTTVMGANGIIEITVVGGAEPYDYLWSNGQITKDISGLEEGRYSVIVTDANGNTSKKYFTVRGVKELSAVITTKNNQNSNTSNGSITIKIMGGLSPYTVVVTGDFGSKPYNNVSSALVIPDLYDGDYTILITDSQGTPLSKQATVGLPDALQINDVSSTDPTCIDLYDGVVTFKILGGTPSYKITLVNNTYPGGVYSVAGPDDNNIYTFDSLRGGNYSLSVEDFYQQYQTINVPLVQPQEMVLTKVPLGFVLSNTVTGVWYTLVKDGIDGVSQLSSGGEDKYFTSIGSGNYYVRRGETCTSNPIVVS